LRAGTPGDSGVLVVTRVRSIATIAHEAAGATGIRRSPRPLWAEDKCMTRAQRVAGANVYLELEQRHCERSEAIHQAAEKNGLLRFARNDGSTTNCRWLFEN
jgi:hypothetical protein